MLDIDKKEMDLAWHEREKSEKFYKYIYSIAESQVARRNIKFEERDDFIQFCVMKCYNHSNSYNPDLHSSSFSFFWKQISLAISYMLRKDFKKKVCKKSGAIKNDILFVEQEKILDWIESNQDGDGTSFKDIVEVEELQYLKKLFKEYNKEHTKVKPSKETAIKVVKWAYKKDKGILDNFTTLKPIFKNWLKIID